MVSGERVECPACTRVFDAAGGCGEKDCGEARGCALVKCPSCGEEFRPASPIVGRLVEWLRSRAQGGKRDAD